MLQSLMVEIHFIRCFCPTELQTTRLIVKCRNVLRILYQYQSLNLRKRNFRMYIQVTHLRGFWTAPIFQSHGGWPQQNAFLCQRERVIYRSSIYGSRWTNRCHIRCHSFIDHFLFGFHRIPDIGVTFRISCGVTFTSLKALTLMLVAFSPIFGLACSRAAWTEVWNLNL